MYYLNDMVDMGLEKDQEWPSTAHKKVAINIATGNSLVTTKEVLTEVVQAVLKVPKNRIMLITHVELVNEFNCPGILGGGKE